MDEVMGVAASEQWRPVGYAPRYAISSEGRLYNTTSGRFIEGQVDSRGYQRVHISVGGKFVKIRVHRLVCEGFHGLPQDGQEVCHIDGDRSNNRATNLRWGTRSDNVRDAIRHGTFVGDPTAARAARWGKEIAGG